MTASEHVRWQFWGLALFFGVILPAVVGLVVWGWRSVWRRTPRKGCEGALTTQDRGDGGATRQRGLQFHCKGVSEREREADWPPPAGLGEVGGWRGVWELVVAVLITAAVAGVLFWLN